MEKKPEPATKPETPLDGPATRVPDTAPKDTATKVQEIGGRKKGLDPTRYGDWEKNGRCIDF